MKGSLRSPAAVAAALLLVGIVGMVVVYRTGSANRKADRVAVESWTEQATTIVERVRGRAVVLREQAGAGPPLERAELIVSIERDRAELAALPHPTILAETVARFDAWIAEVLLAARTDPRARAEIAATLYRAGDLLNAALADLDATRSYLRRNV